MPYAAAVSEHPLATHAVGEVLGQVLEALGDAPDLAVLIVSAAHTGTIEDIARTVRAVLAPRTLIGCTAGTVVAGGRELEDTPAVALWAARVPTVVGHRLSATLHEDDVTIQGFPAAADLPPDASVVLLFGDPFTFPTEDALAAMRERLDVRLPVIGGLASAARGPGGNRLLLNDRVHVDGAVAAVLGGVEVATIVSQGCRPIGEPLAVTRSSGMLLEELAGRPALERVQSTLQRLDPEDLELARHGLHIGRVVTEQRDEFARGDFLVRNVLGGDPSIGAVAVGDEVPVGATVQLHVRDAASAAADLRAMVAGSTADGALLFTCNGRGRHLFGVPDHDAGLVHDALDRVPMVGMSCQGEIGPVGGRSFLHTFTASVLLLTD
jgi:small ligand-binding sensory domain FIST